MASYKLLWKRSAEKELRTFPRDVIAKVILAAESLTENPFPSGVRKLVGTDNIYRVRTGDYRLVYRVEGELLIVEVIRVGHRKDVYR
ncbi:MAG: type II toxin-antitoxin system RelE/ParE family toxin [Gammaproteobacteria bacterium]|nr:type II toxin-antitoxin system RelE/ParE family toxin [Gammaproteobacteria bacterium]